MHYFKVSTDFHFTGAFPEDDVVKRRNMLEWSENQGKREVHLVGYNTAMSTEMFIYKQNVTLFGRPISVNFDSFETNKQSTWDKHTDLYF